MKSGVSLDSAKAGVNNSDMTFTQEERKAIEHAGSVAVTVDGIDCVVLRAEVYDRVRAVLTNSLDHDELRAILARSAENSDWLDPSMDIYDEYAPIPFRRPTS